jgi:hypothetical protein
MITVAGSPFPLWVGKESSELSRLRFSRAKCLFSTAKVSQIYGWNMALQPREQLRNVHFEGHRDGMKRIDPGGYGAILDLREMRSADLGHIRELRLREATFSPYIADSSAKADRERYCHSAMISFNVTNAVRYTEQ